MELKDSGKCKVPNNILRFLMGHLADEVLNSTNVAQERKDNFLVELVAINEANKEQLTAIIRIAVEEELNLITEA